MHPVPDSHKIKDTGKDLLAAFLTLKGLERSWEPGPASSGSNPDSIYYVDCEISGKSRGPSVP